MSSTKQKAQFGTATLFLLFSLYHFVLIACGKTVVPWGRWGGDRPLEMWQMVGLGVILLIISVGLFVSSFRTLVLTKTLTENDQEHEESQNQQLPYPIRPPRTAASLVR